MLIGDEFSVSEIECVTRNLHLNREAGYDALTIENIVYVFPSIYMHLKQLPV